MAVHADESRLGKAYTADRVTVYYDRALPPLRRVRGTGIRPEPRPWIRADLAEPELVSEIVRRCPTGALHCRLANGVPEEAREPTSVRRDPHGPLLVTGEFVLDTPDGAIRETRAALCRCGATKLEPFCDGACGVNQQSPAGTRDEGQTTA